MTNCDSAPSKAPRGAWSAAWRAAALLYLATLLAGLAAGLWPEKIVPSLLGVPPAAPRCAVQTLAVTQVLFLLLVYPVVIARRADRGRIGRYGREVFAESLAMLAASAPAYLVAAYLSDAVAQDVLRALLYVACVWSLLWAVGAALAARPGGRWAVILALQVLALGLPAAQYIAREFAQAAEVGWLWELTPATMAWQAAASRQGTLLPGPWWAALVWPALAAGVIALHWLVPSRAQKEALCPQGTEC